MVLHSLGEETPRRYSSARRYY